MNNESGSKNNEWTKEFSDEMRQKIGNKLMDRLSEVKSRLNAYDPNSLAKCYQASMQYEGKVFHSMTSKEDYLNNIRLQQLKQFTPSVASTATTNSVEQGGSSMQNMPGRQNQPPKQPNYSPLIDQSEIFRSHLYKLHQQFASEPPPYQHFQQATIESQPGKQSSEQHLNNTTIIQQNQKFVQQRNASEQKQQPLCLQKSSNSLLQPLVLKDNVSETPQLVTLGVSKSNVLNFQQQQNPYEQHGTPTKSSLPTEAIQEGFQHFPSLYPSQGLADQQKLYNSKRALPEASPLIDQSEIFRSHLYKRQKQTVSEPHQYQHCQLVAMNNPPGKQSSEQHFNNTTIVQQDQKLEQKRNALEWKQQPLCLPKTSNSVQQPLELKDDVFVTPQPVNLGVSKSNALNFQQQQNHGSPNHAQGLADQQKIRNSKRAHPEASTEREASASNEILDVADWHHQAYQELESLRKKCVPTLKLLFQKFEKNKLESKSEVPDRHKRQMSELARMINFLHASPNDIARISKNEFDCNKRTIIHTDNTIRNSIATLQRAQLQSSQPQISSQQQRGNGNAEFQSENLASRSAPDGPSARSMEHPETLTHSVQINKKPMEMQNTIEGENPQMLQHQQLIAQHVECPFEYKPSVASRLSSPTCRPQSTESVVAETEHQSLTVQPIDHQCAVASNLNPSVASRLSSDTCPQSAVASTLDDGLTEHQSTRVQYLHTSASHDITPHAFDALIPSVDETEPIGASRNKRQKTEAKYNLLDEIDRINQRLIETVVDMESSEVDLESDIVKGKVVKCSYVPMAVRKAYKSYISSDVFPELKLRVLVPVDYPNSSPVVLDGLTTESTCDKSKEFTEKVKFKLDISACLLSEPFSLEEIVRAWDQCCRAVFCEFAPTQGRGSFSSRFGSWEVCCIY